jgi:hypothetical protein
MDAIPYKRMPVAAVTVSIFIVPTDHLYREDEDSSLRSE